MTQERFIKLLDNPAEVLASITYEELKTLTLAYPYAHNLRTLLALKARQDGHPEASRALGSAAAYSLDRTRLFLLIHPTQVIAPQKVEEELVFELKPIETVQRRLESLEALDRVSATDAAPATNAVETPEREERPKASDDIQPTPVGELSPQNEAPISVATVPLSIQTIPIPEPVEESSAAPPFELESPQETPVQEPPIFVSFNDWVGTFQMPALSGELQKNVLKKPSTQAVIAPESIAPAKQPPSTAQTLAEKSVTENKDVISETLAKLLARQGNKEKAIAMYERLCLVFPDKSATFAAEIEKLR